ERAGQRLVLRPAPGRRLPRRQRVTRHVHEWAEDGRVDTLLAEEREVAVEGIERLEERAGGRLGPDHEPGAVAVVEDPHAVALRGLPGGLDRPRREEVDVD